MAQVSRGPSPDGPLGAHTVYHGGRPQPLTPIVLGTSGRIRGYHLQCPACRRGMFLNTGMGAHPDHTVVRTPEGGLSMRPPLQCPFPDCTWTAMLTDNVLYELRRRRDRGPRLQ